MDGASYVLSIPLQVRSKIEPSQSYRKFYIFSDVPHTHTLLHTKGLTHTSCHTRTLLHTDADTHTQAFTRIIICYTQTLLHTASFYIQGKRGGNRGTGEHTDAFTLLHTRVFTHRSCYPQKLSHKQHFTHRTLLHTLVFTHKKV